MKIKLFTARIWGQAEGIRLVRMPLSKVTSSHPLRTGAAKNRMSTKSSPIVYRRLFSQNHTGTHPVQHKPEITDPLRNMEST